MKTPAMAAPTNVPLLSIAMMVAGVSIGALNGTLMKAAAAELPEAMASWGRYVIYLAIMLVIVLWRSEPGVLRPRQPGLQILRGAFQCFATWAFMVAVGGMPVADAIAIIYVYPFALTAVAPFLLGERVPMVSWIGVIAGFLGVLLVIRPELGQINSNALWALASGVAISGQLIINRKLASVSSAIATSTVSAIVGTAILSAVVPWQWKTPGWYAIALILALGASSALNQWMVLVAFARAPASLLAPFGYVEIPAGVLIGFLWFGDVPDKIVWLGITVIIASGLIVARSADSRRLPRATMSRPGNAS